MKIAIDGPAGAGKGTITSLVAEELNLVTIDTGATYRCVALQCLNENVTLDTKTGKVTGVSSGTAIIKATINFTQKSS